MRRGGRLVRKRSSLGGRSPTRRRSRSIRPWWSMLWWVCAQKPRRVRARLVAASKRCSGVQHPGAGATQVRSRPFLGESEVIFMRRYARSALTPLSGRTRRTASSPRRRSRTAGRLGMVKRRAKAVNLTDDICNNSSRAHRNQASTRTPAATSKPPARSRDMRTSRPRSPTISLAKGASHQSRTRRSYEGANVVLMSNLQT